ncbi:MAG: hypothetical protein ACLU4N_15135 [Butyricimonas faecihominis]
MGREFQEGLPMDMFDFFGNKFGDCAWIWDPEGYINVVIFDSKVFLQAVRIFLTYGECGFTVSYFLIGMPTIYPMPTFIVWHGIVPICFQGTSCQCDFRYDVFTLAHEMGHYLTVHPFVDGKEFWGLL